MESSESRKSHSQQGRKTHLFEGDAIPDDTTVAVNVGTEKYRSLRDYNMPEDFYANSSALHRSTLHNTVFELNPAYTSLLDQHPFHCLPHEDITDHLESI